MSTLTVLRRSCCWLVFQQHCCGSNCRGVTVGNDPGPRAPLTNRTLYGAGREEQQ